MVSGTIPDNLDTATCEQLEWLQHLVYELDSLTAYHELCTTAADQIRSPWPILATVPPGCDLIEQRFFESPERQAVVQYLRRQCDPPEWIVRTVTATN